MGRDNGRVIMEGKEIEAALERLSEEIIASTNDPGKLALVGIHTGRRLSGQQDRGHCISKT